ncbi:TPA: class C sortase [Streptococcus suis]|uniref:Class C sortase n=1 Tax=Streptococcus suis TaxID=1307 RepID=A0A0Z8HDZ2_STRSU|nr:class C sortase [Streptococcus suis]MCQ8785294.1 class C sortase [Streptococcus suis]MDW8719900.1 class C sortase [Streptococcus suis]NQH43032.1 class C sortase [Streptococcus suis]NQH56225.1 class C sortase [Streptococcus suis]NQN63946.1 class C sortase [Streptococcus suis]
MKLKIVGYLLMIVGLLLPLLLFSNMTVHEVREFFAYQSYKKSESGFSKKEEEVIEHYQEVVRSGRLATVDPFAETRKDEQSVSDFGDRIIGYLSIPSLEIRQPIWVGASDSHLDQGVAVVSGTDLPFGGLDRRSVLAGHRSWYSDLRFFRLNEMREGDEIFVEIGEKVVTYRVKNTEIIKATDWQKLLPIEKQDVLTLLTCDPLVPPFDYRLLVNAYRYHDSSEQAVSTSEEKRQSSQAVLESYRKKGLSFLAYLTLFGWFLFVYLACKLLKLVRECQITKVL